MEKVLNLNEQLRSTYEHSRFQAAAGDMRKTWNLYNEILFKRKQRKSTISINGLTSDDSLDSCNKVNDHFCSAGEKLGTSIIAIHGYGHDDIDSLYPENADNDWSFEPVNDKVVALLLTSYLIRSLLGSIKYLFVYLNQRSLQSFQLLHSVLPLLFKRRYFPLNC